MFEKLTDFFAVMMDETIDSAHLEQVSVVVQYYDENCSAVERLSLNHVRQQLGNIWVSSLNRLNLDPKKL